MGLIDRCGQWLANCDGECGQVVCEIVRDCRTELAKQAEEIQALNETASQFHRESVKQAERVAVLEKLISEVECSCEYELDEHEPNDATEYRSWICPKCRSVELLRDSTANESGGE